MEEVDVEFTGGGATQVFRIGAALVRRPRGRRRASRMRTAASARCRGRELIAPAAGARAGRYRATGRRRRTCTRSSTRSSAPIPRGGRSSRRGHPALDRRSPGHARTSADNARDVLAREGAAALYEGGAGARRLVEHVRAGGGTITARRPARLPRRPPAAGQRCLRRARVPLEPAAVVRRDPRRLRAEAARPPAAAAGGHRRLAMAELVEILREQARARQAWRPSDLYRGGLRDALLGERAIAAALGRIANAPAVAEPPAARGTTHISAVDRVGNAASLTISTGSGRASSCRHRNPAEQHAGRVRPQRHRRAGRNRLTSMMAPSIVVGPDGAAARSRQRGVATAPRRHPPGGHQRRPARHVGRGRHCRSPRLHVDDEHVHLEGVPTAPRPTRWRPPATSSSAGGGATSSSAARRRSSGGPTASCTPPATRAAAATASWYTALNRDSPVKSS